MDSRAENWGKQGDREPVCWESDPGRVPFPLETSSFAAAPVASTIWDQLRKINSLGPGRLQGDLLSFLRSRSGMGEQPKIPKTLSKRKKFPDSQRDTGGTALH